MTQLLTEKQISEGVKIIKSGGLVAFRTETVYGLAVDALNEKAAQKIYQAKNRPKNKPLVMQFASVKELLVFFPKDVDKITQKILKKLKVGLTVILPNGQGVRIPADRFAKRFLCACKTPLFVTSANISDRPSPTTWEAVYNDLNNRVDAIFMSKPCKVGIESTIIEIIQGKIKIIRKGAISEKTLAKFLPVLAYP